MSELRWMYDVPFASVPKEFIESLGLDYSHYLTWCKFMDALPTYWNIALFYKDRMALFTWGTFDFLEGLMHIVRIVTHPALYRVDGKLVSLLNKEYREIAQGRRIYFISDRWKAFLRKFPNDLKLTEARVLEVSNV